jgi:hypothetical protein
VGKGFWLPLDEALDISADVDLNHYINNLPDEKRLGSHQFDWNVVPGPGDRLATPISKRFQMVRFLLCTLHLCLFWHHSTHCFASHRSMLNCVLSSHHHHHTHTHTPHCIFSPAYYFFADDVYICRCPSRAIRALVQTWSLGSRRTTCRIIMACTRTFAMVNARMSPRYSESAVPGTTFLLGQLVLRHCKLFPSRLKQRHSRRIVAPTAQCHTSSSCFVYILYILEVFLL